ncbi:Fic family protein [Sphingosinicella rhizophila]|uniref:Fic family protein n=1 Tax=Sphingosinicella rhizophila TaxID=3050082 RepID=A0ABU3Q9D2_9SPHN|nr:Fic family protein [Sphingosinicella sp. GR2756]MDT9600015.1 Fic family protein [Sphingosinicella sp. GR2756]
MIHDYPTLEAVDKDVLSLIREQRKMLRHQVGQTPLRWSGFLRKNTFARALQGSNSIEGINANLAEAVAIIDEERPDTLEEETIRALQGYRTAMTYLIRVHDDPHTQINAQFIRSLHYMMINYDMTKLPGQWRTGPVYVVHEPSGDTVYEGPPADEVPRLINELVAQINSADDVDSSTVLGAMAHLNLAMIHPFKDGNGRMARALQTLIIAQNGASSPTFCSIEEWLGRNTQAYYEILKEVGRGSWNPGNSALPWVRFCLRAHYQQAATLMKRNAHFGRVWEEISKITREHGLNERVENALLEAAFGYKIRNQRYREEGGISDVVASRDLKRLCELGLLSPVGEKRGRYYVGDLALLDIALRTRDTSKAGDPYKMIAQRGTSDQLPLVM